MSNRSRHNNNSTWFVLNTCLKCSGISCCPKSYILSYTSKCLGCMVHTSRSWDIIIAIENKTSIHAWRMHGIERLLGEPLRACPLIPPNFKTYHWPLRLLMVWRHASFIHNSKLFIVHQ